ncbi:MAG: high-potential iron-sulfur protein [Methyloceanibacter sp.]
MNKNKPPRWDSTICHGCWPDATGRQKRSAGTFLGSNGFSPAKRALFLGNVRRACMTNPSSSINKGICRRSLLKSVPLIAGAIISTNAVAQNLFAQAKVTHDAAKYQDHPNNGQQCSNCVQFVAPASCKVVEDPIGASGWCQLFVAKPA